jgi:hypothetical protein
MIKLFKITPGGRCPICRAPVTMRLHALCVLQLDDMIRRGEAELLNWTDPLPGQFTALRSALYFQLARTEVVLETPQPSSERLPGEPIY